MVATGRFLTGPGRSVPPAGELQEEASGCRVTITHSAFMFMMPRSTTTEYVDKQGW